MNDIPMTLEEAFYLLLFILFIVYLWTPSELKTKKIRLGDFLMEHLPCTQADKVNLIKWIIVLKAGIKVEMPSLTLEGSPGVPYLLANFLCKLFPVLEMRGMDRPGLTVINLRVKGKPSLFPISIKFTSLLLNSSSWIALLKMYTIKPKHIHWPVHVVEGQGNPIIHHEGEI